MFYRNLIKVLKQKKVSFFQLRIKRKASKKKYLLEEKLRKFVKNSMSNF